MAHVPVKVDSVSNTIKFGTHSVVSNSISNGSNSSIIEKEFVQIAEYTSTVDKLRVQGNNTIGTYLNAYEVINSVSLRNFSDVPKLLKGWYTFVLVGFCQGNNIPAIFSFSVHKGTDYNDDHVVGSTVYRNSTEDGSGVGHTQYYTVYIPIDIENAYFYYQGYHLIAGTVFGMKNGATLKILYYS